jgi:hypothetical protein
MFPGELVLEVMLTRTARKEATLNAHVTNV